MTGMEYDNLLKECIFLHTHVFINILARKKTSMVTITEDTFTDRHSGQIKLNIRLNHTFQVSYHISC